MDEHKIKIRLLMPKGYFSLIWCGECTCGRSWKYWNYGATLGYGLEHLRRHR